MPQNTTAATIMDAQPPTFGVEDDLLMAADVLLARGLDGAAVLGRDGELVGVITLADVLYGEKQVRTPQPIVLFDALLTFGAGRKMAKEFDKMTATSVGAAMSAPPITVQGSDLISRVASLMIDKNLTVVPVLDTGSRLLGMIDRRDIVRFTLRRFRN
jgi:CBS domain-containing protein